VAPIYELLLQPAQPLELQDAAWDSLKQRLQVEAAELAIASWPTLGPQMRTRVMDWLPSFEAGRTAAVQALESGRIAFAELTASQRTALAQVLPAEQWTALEKRFAGPASSADRAAVFATYREALAQAPDLVRGRELFRKTCSECHRLEDVGHEIGPNLVSLQNRGAETILTNVLEPNREVNPQYVNYVAETTDGRVLTGLIQSETATSIRLLRAGNQSDTLLRSDLETLRSTGLSLMPSNLEQQIPPDAMSDLIGFILSVGR
jgi:putative heme-binding domain-containing protein